MQARGLSQRLFARLGPVRDPNPHRGLRSRLISSMAHTSTGVIEELESEI